MTLTGPIDVLVTFLLAVRRFGLGRTLLASILLAPVYSWSLPPVPCTCIRTPFRRCAPSRAYMSAVKSDLKNLASQQEIYFSDVGSYSADFAALGFTPSVGVEVTLLATADSWVARATHSARGAGEFCAIHWGDEPPSRLGLDDGQRPGEIVCTS